MYPGNQRSSILEGSFSINSPCLILTPSSHPSLFQHPWPSPSPFTWPWVMWSFWFGLSFIHGLPSIKAAPFLYYTLVLISTKITALSLWDPSKHQPKGLKKLKDWDYLWAQHISWSLVLLSGQNHGMFASPSEVPATSWFHIGFQCGSVLNTYYWISQWYLCVIPLFVKMVVRWLWVAFWMNSHPDTAPFMQHI